jgi:hypothetical protein
MSLVMPSAANNNKSWRTAEATLADCSLYAHAQVVVLAGVLSCVKHCHLSTGMQVAGLQKKT